MARQSALPLRELARVPLPVARVRRFKRFAIAAIAPEPGTGFELLLLFLGFSGLVVAWLVAVHPTTANAPSSLSPQNDRALRYFLATLLVAASAFLIAACRWHRQLRRALVPTRGLHEFRGPVVQWMWVSLGLFGFITAVLRAPALAGAEPSFANDILSVTGIATVLFALLTVDLLRAVADTRHRFKSAKLDLLSSAGAHAAPRSSELG